MPTLIPPPETQSALSATLARNWWAVALRGAFAILFGLVTFVQPGIALASLVVLFAAYMLVDGVFAIMSGVRAAQTGHRWGLLVLEGVADILAAAVALAWPAITVLVFTTLIAVWSIVSGLFMTVAAFRLGLDHERWLLALSGLVSVGFGILLLLSPFLGAIVLTLWLGAYAFVFGILLVALALRLRARHAA